MFTTLPAPWQAAFALCWEAFTHGSIPIGAVITDEAGAIISTGRNRLFEPSGPNPKIAHAETEALRSLDVQKHPNLHGYTLYATMEPCPMCMGTFIMANLRTLRVAARDAYCGAVHYLQDDPYMASKKINATFEYGELEFVQLALQGYHEYRLRDGKANPVLDRLAGDNPRAIETARRLYDSLTLDEYARLATPFPEVFDAIAAEYR